MIEKLDRLRSMLAILSMHY